MKLPEVLTVRANIMLDPEIMPRDFIEGLGPGHLEAEVIRYIDEIIPKLDAGQSLEIFKTGSPEIPYRLIFRAATEEP